MEKQILCFGDSNTWGYDPQNGVRFSSRQRWTGLLQEALNKQHAQWRVAEEGLNGRTTVFGEKLEPHRVGLPTVAPLVMTHKPLAAIIVMLGTNDTKIHYHASAQEIAMGMDNILRQIYWACSSEGTVPPILLISPKPLNPDICNNEFDAESAAKSAALAPLYERVAKRFGCDFLDLGAVVPGPCFDGIHLSEDQHRIAAEAISRWALSVLEKTAAAAHQA